MTLFAHLEQQANANPDKTAISCAGLDTSYAQLLRHSQTIATMLQHKYLLEPGDRVAVLSENAPDIFALLFAASAIGVIVVPLNWRLSQDELKHAIDDSTPTLLIHSDNYTDAAQNIVTDTTVEHVCEWVALCTDCSMPFTRLNVAPKADFLLVYTSGTTGRPKGAVLSQQALITSAQMSVDAFSLNESDSVLCVLPLFHVGGLNIQALPALLNGATLVLLPVFNPHDTIAAIREHAITQALVVPTILAVLLTHPDWNKSTLASLRCLGIGSMDVPVAQLDQVHSLGISVVQIYGATETGPVAIHQKIDNAMSTVGSIGQCGEQCQIMLLDDVGNEVGIGMSGEIAVKGDNIFTRYWNNPDATKATIENSWFKTGDVAKKDANNNYWFTDRLKNVIISGGENIYAAEVERVLSTASGVSEVSVVGLPDEKWGETVAAAIVLDSGTTVSLDSLQNHCAEQLAKFKQPKQYYRFTELPRNALGKIQSDSLKNLITSNSAEQIT